MSTDSRRRSSQHPKRISLLPYEIHDENPKPKPFNVTKAELQKSTSYILSSILTVNSELSESDGITPFSENIQSVVDEIFDNLGCSSNNANEEAENGQNDSSSSMNDRVLPLKVETMEYRTQRIKDLNEERSKWIKLLQKFEENAICPGPSQQPNKIIEYRDVPESVKKRASKSQYTSGNFPYKEITRNCQTLTDKTLFEMESCVDKANQIKKIHSKFSYLIDEQFENFMLNVQDTSILSTSDSDIRQVIEKRIALVSPSNNK